MYACDKFFSRRFSRTLFITNISNSDLSGLSTINARKTLTANRIPMQVYVNIFYQGKGIPGIFYLRSNFPFI